MPTRSVMEVSRVWEELLRKPRTLGKALPVFGHYPKEKVIERRKSDRFLIENSENQAHHN